MEGPSDEAKPAEATETAGTIEPAAEAAETSKAAPKPTKRGSIFGSLASKLRSPTTEKEADTVPPVPAKDEPATETPAEAPKIEENPAEATETPTEAPKETSEETPKEEALKEEAPATTPAAALKSKRGSIFGNLTGSVKKEKSDGEGEAKTNKLTGLFRNASKAGKSKDVKKKDATTPPKVEEAAEPATEETPASEAAPTIEPTLAAEPNSIGDAVSAAVTVGQAPKSTPEVSAAA